MIEKVLYMQLNTLVIKVLKTTLITMIKVKRNSLPLKLLDAPNLLTITHPEPPLECWNLCPKTHTLLFDSIKFIIEYYNLKTNNL